MPNRLKKNLLDASAMIALLKKEKGWELLEDKLATSAISSVNLSEVVSVLVRSQVEDEEIDQIIKTLTSEVLILTEEIAILAGKLINVTRDHGLSLGDRVCIATGIVHDMRIYTTDKAWVECKIKDADIVLLR